MNFFKRSAGILLLLLILPGRSFSWIYPEHRDILIFAIQKLDPARRDRFERLWTLAIRGHEGRLTARPADTGITGNTRVLDYASFPAIAGDHSTSASDMVGSILNSEWILKVSDVAMSLKEGLANSSNRSESLNKLRDSDLRLLKVDPDYVTRAGANNVHFLLARPDVNTVMQAYIRDCIKPGAELNALGTYVWYHTSALRKARAYAADPLAANASELLLSAYADEGFAIHFLEDIFASGHVAGTWGKASQRKGTHDYYDERGLEVSTWSGKKLVLMGDAFMRPQDADLAAVTVVKSLDQFIDALSGSISLLPLTAEVVTAAPDTFNVCKDLYNPPRVYDSLLMPMFSEVLKETAMPGLASGAGELPRFRAEVGPFVGFSAAARANVLFNGYSVDQHTAGLIPGLEMSIRLGLGLEGVLNEAGDGLVFLDIGWRLDGPSTMTFEPDPDLKIMGTIFSAIRSRDALYARLRMPYYIIPGDLLLLAPILYLVSPKTMNRVVATAGNGGLIPWQTGIVTPIGRFQFVLGREVGVYFFGTTKAPDTYFIPIIYKDEPDLAVISMRTAQLEFPFLEYRPFHNFANNHTASLMLQFFGGFDIPGKATLIIPDDIDVPEIRTIPFLGLRLVFDWRYYFGKKS
jgi:hypothetical protein